MPPIANKTKLTKEGNLDFVFMRLFPKQALELGIAHTVLCQGPRISSFQKILG